MAIINFLNTVNFNGNETQNQVIHNLAANPSAANSELGQIYFNTASNQLRVCTNASTPTWTAVGAGVSDFSSAAGTYVTVTNYTNATGSIDIGTVDLSAIDGTATGTTRFLDKNNKWSVPVYYTDADVDTHLNTSTATNGQILSYNTGTGDYDWVDNQVGDITEVVAGTYLTGGGASGSVTLNHANTTRTDTTSSASPAFGGTFTAVDSVTSNATGHIIALNLKTVTLPTPSTYSFTVDANTGTPQPITSGNTLSIDGDTTYINTVVGATDTVTINHATISQSDTTSSASPAYGGTFDVIDVVSRNSAGHVTGVNVKTVTIPSAYSFSAAGDTGTAQPITNGNTLTIAGSTGIDTVAEATDTIRVNLDLAELTTVTTIDPAADFLVGVDGTANEKILYSNVHLNQWGAAEGNISLGSNKITNLADGTASADAVNLGQLQTAVAGVGKFQGGYNASTNSPALTGASNVALDQGDFYVVTTGGSFFTETLEVGDLIFANNAIAASSSPSLSDYTVVIADQNIAGAGATDGATEKGVAGFDSANFDVSVNGWVQIKAGGVILGTETTGTYVTSVVESTANNRKGIAVVTSGAGDAKTETVGLNIIGQTNLTGLQAADDFIVYDNSATTNKRVGADEIATYVKSTIEKRDAYLVLNSATSGVASTNNGSDTISWTLDLSVLDTNGVIDIGTNVNAVKVEVINVADTAFDTGVTLNPSVERAATTGDVTIEFVKKTWATAGLPSQGDYAVLLSYVGAY